MQLVNTKETFERVYEGGQDPISPVFILKKLTHGEMSVIADETAGIDEKDRLIYKAGTVSKLKIRFSVVAWRNIYDESGNEAQCNDANKEKLPPDIGGWLIQEIDKLNKLSGIPKEERKN